MNERPEIIELEVAPDGTIRTMYKDGIDTLLGAEIKSVERASNVEWEGKGWTVRAAHDPEIALRWVPYPPPTRGVRCAASRDPSHRIAVFQNREQALAFERNNFWDLLPQAAGNHENHGRGDENGPHEGDCPCRGGTKQSECADKGCGFCSSAEKR